MPPLQTRPEREAARAAERQRQADAAREEQMRREMRAARARWEESRRHPQAWTLV